MSKNSNIGQKERSDIEAYLGNRMSESERNSFERRLEADPFLREALEGLSGISSDDLTVDIDYLLSAVETRTGRRRLPVWYRISAAVVILMVVSSLFFVRQLSDKHEVASVSDKEMVETNRDELVTAPEMATGESGKVALSGKREQVSPENIIPTEREKQAEKIGEPVTETATREDILPAAKNIVMDKGVADQRHIEETSVVIADDIITDTLKRVEEVVAAIVPGVEVRRAKRAAMNPVAELQAPDRLVKGTIISSEDSLPLPGTAINIKGTTEGVVTDYNGNFEIKAEPGQVLVANFIGMQPREVKVAGNDIGDILLEPDLLSVDEVVVVGYGIQGRVAGVSTGSSQEVRFDRETTEFLPAEPEGGMSSYRTYISDNQRFPGDYTESDRAVVRLKFTLVPGEALRDFEIINSPGERFSAEAIRLVTEGPAWKPATLDGEPVSDTVRLRIVFRRK